MAKVKDYWGEVQKCIICESEEIEIYHRYTPEFKNVIDSVFICGCKDHTEEAKKEYYKTINKIYISAINCSST